jgi:hypothetical protein
MNKFLFAYIGNENLVRNSYAIPALKSFLSSLKISSTFLSISWQANFFHISRFHTTFLSIYYAFLEIKWLRFLNSNTVISTLGILCGIFSVKSQLNAYICRQLTAKHLRAWEFFMNADADFLVVMEDDVIFKEDSAKRFDDLVLRALSLMTNNKKKFIYFDLAGGFNVDDLNLSKVMQVKGEVIAMLKPATNTTCCYLISKDLAEYFLNQVYENSYLRLLAADWLINSLFLKLKNDYVDCFHFDPPIFIHGSTNGIYNSTIN